MTRDAGIDAVHAEACIEHILADAGEAGLLRRIGSSSYVDLEGVPQPSPDADELDIDPSEDDVEPEAGAPLALNDLDDPPAAPLPAAPDMGENHVPQAIFVAGRKGKSLDQLTKILDEYKIPYLLAEDEPNAGRPISTKVAETMEQCGAAIIVFTPDEELRDLNGEPVWRPSQNMVHELGAAGMQYGRRIVIFREERVGLASNYSDIGHITFKDGELNAKAIELFRELIDFGLVQVTVGPG